MYSLDLTVQGAIHHGIDVMCMLLQGLIQQTVKISKYTD